VRTGVALAGDGSLQSTIVPRNTNPNYPRVNNGTSILAHTRNRTIPSAARSAVSPMPTDGGCARNGAVPFSTDGNGEEGHEATTRATRTEGEIVLAGTFGVEAEAEPMPSAAPSNAAPSRIGEAASCAGDRRSQPGGHSSIPSARDAGLHHCRRVPGSRPVLSA